MGGTTTASLAQLFICPKKIAAPLLFREKYCLVTQDGGWGVIFGHFLLPQKMVENVLCCFVEMKSP